MWQSLHVSMSFFQLFPQPAALCAAALLASAPLVFCAELRMPAIFSEGAVLQKADRVPVWGWANPGDEVSVAVAGAAASVKVDETGRWSVLLDLSDVGPGPHELIAKSAQDEIAIGDVLVGEVWLCSGQSNMEMRLRFCDADGEIGEVNNPEIRHFKVERAASEKPLDDLTGKWIKAQGSDLGEFTAVGYHFAKLLHKELGCPVGLVNSSHGGSVIETWVAEPVLRSREDFWQRSAQLEELMNKQAKEAPSRRPYRLFNGMISPIVPYALAGIIWYQGESNAKPGQTFLYADIHKAMLGDWRQRWGRADLPFYFCQLPNFGEKPGVPGESGAWADLREQQERVLAEAHTGMAVLIDVGEAKDLHPLDKRTPGERLATLVLARSYGRDMVHAGPAPSSYEVVEGGAVRIRFQDVSGGLAARPLPAEYRPKEKEAVTVPLVRNSPTSELEGFELCSADGQWAWANATIDGDSVLVSAPGVAEPVTVRYAWADNPTCNLYNGEGFPAAPFQHQLSAKSQAPDQQTP
jgi:sialate O-acetylesterase